MTIVESFIHKLIRLAPELLTRQLLQLHVSSPSPSLATLENHNIYPNNSNGTSLASLRDRSLRLERTALPLCQTAGRMHTIIDRAHQTIQDHTQTLHRILLLQYHMKFIIRIQLELNKCCQFNYCANKQTGTGSSIQKYSNNMNSMNTNDDDDNHPEDDQADCTDDDHDDDDYYYDWPRDVIRTATSVTAIEELFSHMMMMMNLTATPTSTSTGTTVPSTNTNTATNTNTNTIHTRAKTSTTKIAILEQLRPMVSYISSKVRTITQQKLRAVLQHLNEQVVSIASISTRSTSYDVTYEFGAVLQIYYHLNELHEIVFYVLEQIMTTAMDVTRQLLSQQQSQSQQTPNSIKTWALQLRTSLVQIQTMVGILQQKQDPVTRTKLYTTLFATNNGNVNRDDKYDDYDHLTNTTRNIIMDSVPHVYHEYINRYMSAGSSHQSSSLLVSLFWYRYCAFLSQMLSDALNHSNTNSNKFKKDAAMIISYYPTLHIASYTILQPIFQQPTPSQRDHHNYTRGEFEFSSTSGMMNISSSGNGNGSGILGGTALAVVPFSDDLDNPQSGLNHSHAATGTGSSWTIPQHEQRHVSEMSSYANVVTLTPAMKQSTEWKVYQGQFNDSRNSAPNIGLYPLQQAFVKTCTDRLMVPLQYMFHENVSISDDGVSMSTGILILPSKYDIQRFDENIRDELSLAAATTTSATMDDTLVGDMTLIVQLIAQCVNSIITEFCARAKSAMSNVSHQRHQQSEQQSQPQQHHHHQSSSSESYVNEKDWAMTESMKHDCKIIAILYTVKQYLQSAPEKVFVAPYRTTTTGIGSIAGNKKALIQQCTKTAAVCTETLVPAGVTIDTTIKSTILVPFCRTVNRLIATNVLSKIHLGIYLDNANSSSNSSGSGGRRNYEDMDENDEIPISFVQKDIVPILDKIVQVYLVKFPPPYSNMIVCNIVSFVVYTYLSNVTLIRPLSESIRLHITQDLTDLEMALEQFIAKAASSSSNSKLNLTNTSSGTGASSRNFTTSLSQIDHGKPYAELRAVRQMLFWTGLDTKSKPADDIAKSLLNEIWVKDIRPSTIFHYLFSYGPNMLSSPYHVKRISATEYVTLLVPYDMTNIISTNNTNSTTTATTGNHGMESGEDIAFMTIMACCDSYIQRASVVSTSTTPSTSETGGDSRIAQIVISFGQELSRRRGRQ